MHKNKKAPFAIVTGASRGIGKGIALSLSKQGYDLFLLGKNEQRLSEVAAQIDKLGSSVTYLSSNFINNEGITKAIEFINLNIPEVNLLVINHSIHCRGKVLNEKEFDEVDTLMVNLHSSIQLVKAILPKIVNKQRVVQDGAVIFVNSMAAYAGISGSTGYVSSKAGLLGFANSLFEEIRGLGIKVSSICPGYVNSREVVPGNLSREKMIIIDDIVCTLDYILSTSSASCPTEIKIRPQFPQ